ncbi:neuronal acetylcholine receptor subunit alpha-9-II-like [Antedon mediterranea]|uniref:neuronal acetylcholine receptor subunit alpha-9-II-like n=1 Tax=Antedon mediterranea TaxID=105859 RepID=UPI003AF9A997
MDSMHILPILLITVITSVVSAETVEYVNPSIKAYLVQAISDSYLSPPTTRPVLDTNTTTNITSSFVLTQVIKLDDALQILDISGWITLEWQDEFISWNITDTGIECIQMKQDKIWIPDIVLLQNTDRDHKYFMSDVPVSVCYNGSVRLYSISLFKTFCHINIKYYPKDEQTCVLEFISWTHDINKLDFYPIANSFDQNQQFVENGIWKLMGVKEARTVNNYSFSSYSSLQFWIHLQRRHEFQKTFYLIPYYMCSFLICLMFLVPEPGERISYGITVVLAVIVFNQLIFLSLPPVGDQIPQIGNYTVFHT